MATKEFVGQTLELIPVWLSAEGIFWMKPPHADTLRAGLPPTARPADVVTDMLGGYPLRALLLQPASWRHEGGRTVLTYIAVVEAPTRTFEQGLESHRVEAGKDGEDGEDGEDGAAAAVTHALRHLSWLVRHDRDAARALTGWAEALSGFEPEPFRALV
jgi:hypothetical protein